MKKKLYTRYNEFNGSLKSRDFELVKSIPEVGDYWNGTGCEVVAVNPVKLDDFSNGSAFGKTYRAYKVSYINCGFDEEREDPFVDYIAVEGEE